MTTIDANGNLHDGAGLFSEKTNTAPAGSLSDGGDKRYWGEVSIPEGSRSPWGSVQFATPMGAGAVAVTTAGHGGVKLSRERNAVIPPALRNPNGWYEEDCEVAIVGMYHPDLNWAGPSGPERQIEFENSVKDYFPDKWEAATGGTVQPGESHARDEQLWKAEHADDLITVSAITADSDPDMVRVTARVGGEGDSAEFLVPADEYRQRSGRKSYERFIVDPARHPKLPPKDDAERRKTPAAKADPAKISGLALQEAAQRGDMTRAQAERVSKDLGKLWRTADGTGITTLRDIVAEHDCSVMAEERGGKLTYSVRQPSQPGGSTYYTYTVSKATYDALTSAGVPDGRREIDRARHEVAIAKARVERMRREERTVADIRASRAAAEELEAIYDRLFDAEMAEVREEAARIKMSNADRERAAKISALPSPMSEGSR